MLGDKAANGFIPFEERLVSMQALPLLSEAYAP
jgi:hypothetical protein